ncbi:MAG: substrate-binding domain-containing protein [Thalassolituus sp.]
MKLSNKITGFFLFALLLGSTSTYAETAVIVSNSNANATMDSKTVSRIYLGKSSKFPNGEAAVPVDQADGSGVRDTFNESILGKNSSQLKAYWSRLIFTGKGTPPKELGNDAAVKEMVAKNPNMIGYIDSAAADDSVKVVLTF